MFYFLGILGGICTIMSMILNSRMSVKTSLVQGVLVNFLAGSISSVLLYVVMGNNLSFVFSRVETVPLWALSGGAIAVVIVFLSNHVVPRIPVIYSTVLIFLGQIGAGILIDYFKEGSVSIGKILGAGAILIGILINAKIDKDDLKTVTNKKDFI